MPRLLIAIILLAGACIAALFYLRPEWQRFQALERETMELEEISREFDELIANRDQLLDLVNSISKENLTRLDQILPQGPNASQFLVALEALTLENSVALRRIDLVSPSSERPEFSVRSGSQPRPVSDTIAPSETMELQNLPFNLQVTGPYVAFKKFLVGLERNLRLIDVEEISFNAGAKTELLDFSVKAKTFYQ